MIYVKRVRIFAVTAIHCKLITLLLLFIIIIIINIIIIIILLLSSSFSFIELLSMLL